MYSRHQAGLSLIEVIASIVVLAIALTAVSTMMGVGISRSGEAVVELRAVALAQSYIDEILGKRYDEKTRNRGVPPCRDPALPGVPVARQCTLEGLFGPDSGEDTWHLFAKSLG